MNQAISSATGSKNHGSGGGGVQSFIMNQVVSSVTGSNNTTMDLDLDLVLLDWLVAYYLVVVAITTTTINKIKINLQWVLCWKSFVWRKSHGNGGNGSYNNQGGSYNDRPQQQSGFSGASELIGNFLGGKNDHNNQGGGYNSGHNNNYGGGNNNYGGRNDNYGENDNYGGRNDNYGGRNDNYGGRNDNYGGGYNNNNQGGFGTDNSFGYGETIIIVISI